MARRRVLIEMTHAPAVAAAARGAGAAVADVMPDAAGVGVTVDAQYAPVELPHPSIPATMNARVIADVAPATSTFLVRGDIDEEQIADLRRIRESPGVLGVFSDPPIAPAVTCAGSAPVGTDGTVETLLCVPALHAKGLDGTGVLVAIVDTGFNVAYLQGRGKPAAFDPALSWTVDPARVPGQVAVDHGTMCAFDVQIAAPACTLVDVVLLVPGATFGGVLSDAVRAYSHLLNNVVPLVQNGTRRGLVVNNSWAMFHPSWDFPVGHAGNYSHNANHPFNRIVGSLERAGADILFAAGNCGAPCPDNRCQGLTTAGISGANSHPQVLSIAGVETTKTRVGYSTQGPGQLTLNKPDLAAYTHFAGSGVYAADGGTSAACPVASGVVAALRTALPSNPNNAAASPAAMRLTLINHAVPIGAPGFNFDVGFGILDACQLAESVPAPPQDVTAAVRPARAAAPRVAHTSLGPSPVWP